MARIALDAMGGDFAPHAPVAGALAALRDLAAEHTIQLVGRADVIQATLDELLASDFADVAKRVAGAFEIVHAPDVIAMTDRPSVALRGKPDSSMVVGIRRHADGLADAFVSAGNTGAQMAASTFNLGLHGGLSRPAIATIFPTALNPIVVLDSGANVDCGALELVQFARLGAVYVEDIFGRPNPSIGLLSIGEEAEKGNAVTKEAHKLLAAAPGLNFLGNVEGRDLPSGANDRGPIDVVVCDGFVGNVLLKFYEAVAPFIVELVASHGSLDRDQLAAAFRHLDYSERGGAPLLGVRGVSTICHGKSTPRAIKNAIMGSVQAVETHMSDHIGRRLAPPITAPVVGEGAA